MVRTKIAQIVYRPPRCRYSLNEIPYSQISSSGAEIINETVCFPNNRGMGIKGSFFRAEKRAEGNPCVIYLHGNASSQLEGMFLPYSCSPLGVSVLCIDLSGSGLSDGETIGLGYFEKDDVECAIGFLRSRFDIGKVFLWGRSMGATTALWCSSMNMDICGIISDSPFLSVKEILNDLIGDSWIFVFCLGIFKRNLEGFSSFSKKIS